MRIYALSDIHVDYDANQRWVADLSNEDFRNDLLILAGDVSDTLSLLQWCLGALAAKFRKVLFVPGNHDLWVLRDDPKQDSLQKFEAVRAAVDASGASMEPYRADGIALFPLLGWYDYSFGEPSSELRSMWMDYRACRWPRGLTDRDIALHFASLNAVPVSAPGDTVITYSHFLPRIDLMPDYIPMAHQVLYPILGSTLVEGQLRQLRSRLHVYGHSHVNRRVRIDGVTYVNNAFGYPNETRIASKELLCIHSC